MALLQNMLGLARMKPLSWGELWPEHSKAMQGKLAEVLGKALSDDERAALSQTPCQGELGAILSQSLSQVALRTSAISPKAVPKAVGSEVPAAVEADFRGSLTASWGPTLGLVRPQPSKVSLLGRRLGGGASPWPVRRALGGHGGRVRGRGVPLLPAGLCGHHQPSPLPRGCGPGLGARAGQGLFRRPAWEPPVPERQTAARLMSDFNPLASGEGPHLPSLPHLQPLPSLWQPLIANGVGPSTNQPSVAYGNAPSSHKPTWSAGEPPGRGQRRGRAEWPRGSS